MPKNIKEVRKFLEFINYYKRFIKDFVKIAKPINILTRKNVKQQQKKQKQVFNELKGIFTIKPVLVALDLNKKFRVKANVSNYTTEGVLLMKCTNKLQRPAVFISKLLSNTEHNYKIHDKEILAVIRCLETLKEYKRELLTGTDNKVQY